MNKVIQNFSTIEICNADAEGKRLVSGFMDSGKPNKDGLLLDFKSSLPYILKYIAASEKRTDGVSKGAVRLMHRADPVGKIVEWIPDEATQSNPITTRIDDDEAWKKVQARVLTAFSGGWRVVGKMWQDDVLSKEMGRVILRYTGDPIEVSLVDVPRVDGCEFQSIENVEGKPMTNAEKVENGIWEGNAMAGNFSQLVELLKFAEVEEAAEGEGQELPQELRSALLELKPVIQKYQSKQLDEKLPDPGADDEDVDIAYLEGIMSAAENGAGPGDVENGDFPGHPFRGNQHTKGGAGSSASHLASKDAAHKSASANSAKTSAAHKAASRAHSEAASQAKAAGKEKLAAYHTEKAATHKATAERFAKTEKNGEIPEGDDMKPEDITNIINGVGVKVSEAVKEATKPLEERLAALEAVKNGAPAVEPVAPVSPATPAATAAPQALTAVLHDEEHAAVKNGFLAGLDTETPYTIEEVRASMTATK